jgi:hypothetical protein
MKCVWPTKSSRDAGLILAGRGAFASIFACSDCANNGLLSRADMGFIIHQRVTIGNGVSVCVEAGMKCRAKAAIYADLLYFHPAM